MNTEIFQNEEQENYGKPSKCFPVIPTALNRKRMATGILNEIGAEHEEYRSAIEVLICYPLMKWVLDNKKELEPRELYDDLCGVCSETDLRPFPVNESRFMLFDCYQRAVKAVEEATESLKDEPKLGKKYYQTVMDIHSSSPSDKPISLYYIRVHYRQAVEILCRDSAQKLASFKYEMDALTALDYINNPSAENPAHFCSKLIIENYEQLRSNASSCNWIKDAVAKGTDALKNHPKDGEEMYRIITLMLSGKTDGPTMKQELGLAWNTIVRYRKAAYNCLGTLLFGYSVSEMILWLWENQIEEHFAQ